MSNPEQDAIDRRERTRAILESAVKEALVDLRRPPATKQQRQAETLKENIAAFESLRRWARWGCS